MKKINLGAVEFGELINEVYRITFDTLYTRNQQKKKGFFKEKLKKLQFLQACT